jgi:hypothetical protein
MAQSPVAAPRLEAPEPTHACIRCGRPGLPPEKALCEDCNPLELSQPSATQVHGIAAAGILLFVVILAVVGRWALSGTGPFVGSVLGVSPQGQGLVVTLAVENKGRKAGATTCRIVEQADATSVGELVPTPVIQPGTSSTFTQVLTKLGTEPVTLVADCQSP